MKPKHTNQHALTHRSLDKFNSDQLRAELGDNNRQMNILQDLNEAILKRLQERGLSPIDAPEINLKPKGQTIYAWTDEAESMMDLDFGQTPPGSTFTLQRVRFPEPIVVLADQTLELVMQGGLVVGVDITPTKAATPLSAEELQAMDWYLHPFQAPERKALTNYGFDVSCIGRSHKVGYAPALTWYKGELKRCSPTTPTPPLTHIYLEGDFFYRR